MSHMHSPSKLIPADYQHVLCFAYPGQNPFERFNVDLLVELRRTQPFFRKPSGKGGCDVCGAHFRMGSVFKHVSGEHIVVGWECADKIELLGDLSSSRKEVMLGLERARKLSARRAALRSFVQSSTIELRVALRRDHRIINDIRARLIQWGQMSDAQSALVLKIHREEAEKASRPPEVKVPAPEGKQTVRGEVVSVKTHESDFGFTLKMTVKVTTEGGVWLVWVTVPSGLKVERGDQVEFNATLKRSDRDVSFAFGKRPTKASVLSAAVKS